MVEVFLIDGIFRVVINPELREAWTDRQVWHDSGGASAKIESQACELQIVQEFAPVIFNRSGRRLDFEAEWKLHKDLLRILSIDARN